MGTCSSSTAPLIQAVASPLRRPPRTGDAKPSRKLMSEWESVGNLAEGEGDRRQQKGAAKVRELHGQQLYLESWNMRCTGTFHLKS